MGRPTPVVRPLDDSQGPSPFHGHGPWLVCEVALTMELTNGNCTQKYMVAQSAASNPEMNATEVTLIATLDRSALNLELKVFDIHVAAIFIKTKIKKHAKKERRVYYNFSFYPQC